MVKFIVLAGVMILVSQFAKAGPIVCEGDSAMGAVRVTIAGRNVMVQGAGLAKPAVYRNVSEVYDGHETALITAPGLSIRFADDYGCIRKVEITTNLRHQDGVGTDFIGSFSVPVCRGGSTSDDICLGHR